LSLSFFRNALSTQTLSCKLKMKCRSTTLSGCTALSRCISCLAGTVQCHIEYSNTRTWGFWVHPSAFWPGEHDHKFISAFQQPRKTNCNIVLTTIPHRLRLQIGVRHTIRDIHTIRVRHRVYIISATPENQREYHVQHNAAATSASDYDSRYGIGTIYRRQYHIACALH